MFFKQETILRKMGSLMFLDDYGNERRLKKGAKVIFRPAVYVLITNSKKELLMVLNNGSKKWEIPGGGLEIGEDLVECGVREVKEETGFDVKIDGDVPKFIIKDLSVGSAENYEHGLIFYFAGKLKSSKNGNQKFAEGEKILEVKFFSEDELKNLDIAWWQKDIVEKFVKK